MHAKEKTKSEKEKERVHSAGGELQFHIKEGLESWFMNKTEEVRGQALWIPGEEHSRQSERRVQRP